MMEIREFLSSPDLFAEIAELAQEGLGVEVNGYTLSGIDSEIQSISLDVTYESTTYYDDYSEYNENDSGVGSNEGNYTENTDVAHVSIESITGFRALLNHILLKKTLSTELPTTPPIIKHRF